MLENIKRNQEVTPQIDPSEFSVAEEAAQAPENQADVYVHTCRKPFSWDGKTYDKITFDYSQLTGKDMLAIETELQQLGKPVIAPSFSGEFLYRLAARAAHVSADTIENMPAADFHKIRSRTRSFLLKTEL